MAPPNFNALNATAEPCMNAAKPKATPAVCANKPVHKPNVTVTPMRQPYKAPWVKTNKLSGPGANASASDAAANNPTSANGTNPPKCFPQIPLKRQLSCPHTLAKAPWPESCTVLLSIGHRRIEQISGFSLRLADAVTSITQSLVR